MRTFGDDPAVAQAVEPRGCVRHPVNGFLERQERPVADRFLQEAGRVPEGGDHVEVGTGVGRADQRPRIAQDT